MRKQELYNIMVGSVVGDANELYRWDKHYSIHSQGV